MCRLDYQPLFWKEACAPPLNSWLDSWTLALLISTNKRSTSQTWFAAHTFSRLFSGRVDQTWESGRNQAYVTVTRKKTTIKNGHMRGHFFAGFFYVTDSRISERGTTHYYSLIYLDYKIYVPVCNSCNVTETNLY